MRGSRGVQPWRFLLLFDCCCCFVCFFVVFFVCGFFLSFFFVGGGVDDVRKDPNSTKIGPSSARQRNAILMAFHWRAVDGPTFNAGVKAL